MAKSSVTLWQMLVWAYVRQGVGGYLPSSGSVVARAKWLHFLLATAGDLDSPRPSVDRDAAALHAAVLSLGEDDAALVAGVARNGEQPAPVTTMPRPHPTDTDRAPKRRADERWGWHTDRDGRRWEYLVLSDGFEVELLPKVERARGQKGWKIVGYETRKVPVEYCPLVWQPDPVAVADASEVHAAWQGAMCRLWAEVADFPFLHHALIGIGIGQDAAEGFEVVLHDARAFGAASGGA